jgi:GTP pyrophosphokinase
MKMTRANHAEELLEMLEKKYRLDLDSLMNTVKSYNPEFNEHKFREAFIFAAIAHDGQTRKQENLPYIVHPFETAKILTQIHADEPTLIAALLHDVPEDTVYTLEQIEARFGKQIAYMVEGITKLSKVHYRHDMQQREVESMKKLFIHVAEDPRTMLIKLADRLHNMRTLEYMDITEKRLRKARETLEIFTPIANLLGIKELQAELEDLCFINLYPQDYAKLKEKVQQEKKDHAKDMEKMISDTERELKESKIDAIVYSYQENLYRTYNRLKRENKKIEEIEVTFLINVIVNEIANCYEALGIIHGLYKPQPGKIKDYISLPKANGYQSLHTTVFGHKGINTKYCIRTNQMHFEAQYGIAASYFSPEGKKPKLFTSEDPRSHWVEDIIQIQKDQSAESKYFDELKNYVFQDRINVLTPKGQTFDLPVNATCVDFAYCIHTEVGNRAIRAVVNGNNVPLDYQLNKGDVIKIITTDYPKGPSYEWLGFAKTPLARKIMKEYFKKESSTSKVQVGRKMLQKEYDRAGMGLVNNVPNWKIQKVAQQYPALNIQTTEDILVHIAEGTVSTLEIINLLNSNPEEQHTNHFEELGAFPKQKLTKLSLKVVCDSTVNFAEIINTMQRRKEAYFLLSGDTKYNFLNNKIIYRANMLVRGYSDISNICRELESVPGVEEVQRLFWGKKFIFFLASVVIFMIWAVHPLALYYVTNQWQVRQEMIRLASNTILFAGLILLFSLIFFLKKYTENSFPEYREGTRLWQVAYILSFFALVTIFMEIYLYKLNFDWAWVLASVILIFAYLTGQYIFYKDKNSNQN